MFGFLLAFVLVAVYRERPAVGRFDETDALTFTFTFVAELFARVSQVAEVRDLSTEKPEIESIGRDIYGRGRRDR